MGSGRYAGRDAGEWTDQARAGLASGDLIYALSSARNALRLGARNLEAWKTACEALVAQERRAEARRFAKIILRFARTEDTLYREFAEKTIDAIDAYAATEHLRYGYTNLTHFTRQSDLEAVGRFLDAGADINEKDRYGMTPLHCAALYGKPALISYLLDRGADIEARDSRDETPLVTASGSGNADGMRTLIDRGANVRHAGKEKHTALFYAITYRKDLSLVRMLIEAGASPNETYEYGDNPLLLAVSAQSPPIVQYLLPLTEDPGRMNRHEVCALHFAASYNDEDLIRPLLDAGVDVNLVTASGKTALMDACENNHESCARLLLSRGARTDLTTKYGETARSLAENRGHSGIVELLDSWQKGTGGE